MEADARPGAGAKTRPTDNVIYMSACFGSPRRPRAGRAAPKILATPKVRIMYVPCAASKNMNSRTSRPFDISV